MTAAVSYDELVAAATVGVSQRPLPISALTGPAGDHAGAIDAGDPAASILEAAALFSAARRAGFQPATLTTPPALPGTTPHAAAPAGPGQPGAAPPGTAPPDTAPELSPSAAAWIAFVLQENDHPLLADLLTAAADAGYRAAVPKLPALLDAAARDRSLRRPVAAVLGQRGRWLARHHPTWHRVMAAESAPVPAGPEVWETGTRGERREWLSALRGSDPAAARDLLTATWSKESGEVRTELIAVLATGLSEADEPFLEAALDDRKETVRHAAAGLLALIGSSAFNARAIARASGLLSVERRGIRRELAVALPRDRDAAAIRDGVEQAPLGGKIGRRAWLVTQFIAAVPLRHWTTQLGLDPAALTGLPVQGGFRIDVHAGLRFAAIRQRDAEWAAALLTVHDDAIAGRPPAAWPSDARLAEVLSDEARALWTIGKLKADDPDSEAVATLAAWPGTWPDALADAVLGLLGADRARRGQVQRPSPLLRPAARKLPAVPATAARLRVLADAAEAGSTLAAELRRAADTIDLRHRFLQELH